MRPLGRQSNDVLTLTQQLATLTFLKLNPLVAILLVGAVASAGCKPLVGAPASAAPKDEERLATGAGSPPIDLSGRTRIGNASFYAKRLAGREMADGSRMDPHSDNAASKTLPLGTTARVTNIATGESAVVTIKDRGPYVEGRIMDLSPSTARKIGITEHNGVTEVAVAPISIPLPDGSTKRITTLSVTR
jgi:rare lipoprotein A